MTSVMFVTSSLFFTSAGRRIGSTLVNIVRLVIAVLLLGLTYWISAGVWWPELSGTQLAYLAASGVIGLAACDQCLFVAFVEVGPRRVQLVMTTTPLFAVAFGCAFLDEPLQLMAAFGILLTLGGVAWVVTERVPAEGDPFRPSRALLRKGIVLATVAAACQAAGAWLSKEGMGFGSLPEEERLGTLPATLVRMVFGFLGMLPVLAWWTLRARRRGDAPRAWAAGLSLTAAGAVFGPFLGVWCSLVAFAYSPIGVAQTLCSLSPLLILPLVGPVYGERLSARAIVGALVATGGAVVLFLL